MQNIDSSSSEYSSINEEELLTYIQSLTEDSINSSDSNHKKRKRSIDQISSSNSVQYEPLNKKPKINMNQSKIHEIDIEFPPDIPFIITASLKEVFGSKAKQHLNDQDEETNKDKEVMMNFECNTCEKGFYHKENLDKHLLIHTILSSESDEYPKPKENETDNNKLNKKKTAEIKAWKQLLDGDPNKARGPERKKKEKPFPKAKFIDNKCSTCHTYEARRNGQCDSCQNNKLGMPWCTNCDKRLAFNDYQRWLKENDIDKNDLSEYAVLCQTCIVSLSEFL